MRKLRIRELRIRKRELKGKNIFRIKNNGKGKESAKHSFFYAQPHAKEGCQQN